MAKAELLVFSATDFVLGCPCSEGADGTTLDHGVLVPAVASRFYHTVSFPVNGQQVCSVSLVYQDTNANNAITLTLLKKKLATGINPYGAPIVMATVESESGVSTTTRKATTTEINQPTIAKAAAAYYLELYFPTINLAALAAQVDVRPTCPQR